MCWREFSICLSVRLFLFSFNLRRMMSQSGARRQTEAPSQSLAPTQLASTLPPQQSATATNAATAAETSNESLLINSFLSQSNGEDLASCIIEEITEAAAESYLCRHYDALAVDYTVQSLWEGMTALVASVFVTKDLGVVASSTSASANAAPSVSCAVDNPAVQSPTGASSSQSPPSPSLKTPVHTNTTTRPKPGAKVAVRKRTSSAAVSSPSEKPLPAPRLSPPEKSLAASPAQNTHHQQQNGNSPPAAALPTGRAVTPPPPTTTTAGAPSWLPGDAPPHIPCDDRTRHAMTIRERHNIVVTQTSASFDRSARHRRHRTRDLLDATNANLNVSARPGTAGSSTTMGTEGPSPRIRPKVPLSNTRKDHQSSAAPPTNGTERPSKEAERIPGEAEDAALLAEIAETKRRRQSLVALQQMLTQKISDPKLDGKQFVVDSLAGMVIPVQTVQQDASQKSRGPDGGSIKFAIPTPGGDAAATPASAILTPKGTRPRGGTLPRGGKTSTASLSQEKFFAPELGVVPMVINVAPSGGVSIKDPAGGTQRTDFKYPPSKMSNIDFRKAMSLTNAAAAIPSALDAPPQNGENVQTGQREKPKVEVVKVKGDAPAAPTVVEVPKIAATKSDVAGASRAARQQVPAQLPTTPRPPHGAQSARGPRPSTQRQERIAPDSARGPRAVRESLGGTAPLRPVPPPATTTAGSGTTTVKQRPSQDRIVVTKRNVFAAIDDMADTEDFL